MLKTGIGNLIKLGKSIAVGVLILGCGALPALGQDSSGRSIDFNRDIRPILAEYCWACHGQDAGQRQADLRLDQREAALDSGAIVPGDLEASELVTRILTDDPTLRMPPAGSPRQMPEETVQKLVAWVKEGAPYAEHWAFIPPVRPALPAADPNWVRNPIDHFVGAKLQERGWRPSPGADRRTLIKRLAIDLTGLPPQPAEVEAFVADTDPNAYEKLVERMLASPHFGERMALPWLDAARYADSNGFQQDGDTWQWIWRDWVVQAYNDDLPFDQFSQWQLAGDLLPNATESQKIASAFNRNHLLNGEGGAIPEEQRFVVLFDRMDTTATNWLGLTMACAQCHDHKYDPLTQQDYYSMLDAFNRVPEAGVPTFFSSRIRVDPPFLELPTEEYRARFAELQQQIDAANPPAQQLAEAAFLGWKAGYLTNPPLDDAQQMSPAVAALLKKPAGERTEEDKVALEKELRRWFDDKVRNRLLADQLPWQTLEKAQKALADFRADQLPRLMIMSDDRPRDTFVLNRGAYLSPLEKVTFATPQFLPPLRPEWPRNRLGLAYWLFAEENPLTARVQVNRLWQHFFGMGIVRTSEDFGVQSEYPIHKDLLDWLAVEFREKQWSTKAMIRLMVTSATYRQSSRATSEDYLRDRENRYVSRASRLRMPAMVLRDWALATSGLLDQRVGGKPVYPYQPDGIWESLAITKERDFTYPGSSGSDLYRRSLYTFWRRTVAPANMFDGSNRQACRVRGSITSTPLQALTMLNDPTWVEASRALAETILATTPDDDAGLRKVFSQVVCREPSQAELETLRGALARQRRFFAEAPQEAQTFLAVGARGADPARDPVELAAWSHLCLAIYNLDEALTRE